MWAQVLVDLLTNIVDVDCVAHLQFQAMLKQLEGDLHRSDVVGSGSYRDIWMLRFLMGFHWDVHTAVDKFRAMIAFREKHGLDDIRRK